MSETAFQTDAKSITLEQAPWNVTGKISIYVKHVAGKLSIYYNAQCSGATETPLALEVFRNQATGLYFFIAASSDAGTKFPDPDDGPLPIAWESKSGCPDTVQYGKVRSDYRAFSIADAYTHHSKDSYGFNIVVDPGGGSPLLTTARFGKIDPTIVEKGEDPPPDLGDER